MLMGAPTNNGRCINPHAVMQYVILCFKNTLTNIAVKKYMSMMGNCECLKNVICMACLHTCELSDVMVDSKVTHKTNSAFASHPTVHGHILYDGKMAHSKMYSRLAFIGLSSCTSFLSLCLADTSLSHSQRKMSVGSDSGIFGPWEVKGLVPNVGGFMKGELFRAGG